MNQTSGVPAPERPDPKQQLASRGVAAVAVMVLLGGATLLGLESCAQTSTSKPIQVDPKPTPDQPPTTDPPADPPADPPPSVEPPPPHLEPPVT